MTYKWRVKYKDPGTGEVRLTGLCKTLADAVLKAAMLNGIVVEDDV